LYSTCSTNLRAIIGFIVGSLIALGVIVMILLHHPRGKCRLEESDELDPNPNLDSTSVDVDVSLRVYKVVSWTASSIHFHKQSQNIVQFIWNMASITLDPLEGNGRYVWCFSLDF
jgi:hypothetical protein